MTTQALRSHKRCLLTQQPPEPTCQGTLQRQQGPTASPLVGCTCFFTHFHLEPETKGAKEKRPGLQASQGAGQRQQGPPASPLVGGGTGRCWCAAPGPCRCPAAWTAVCSCPAAGCCGLCARRARLAAGCPASCAPQAAEQAGWALPWGPVAACVRECAALQGLRDDLAALFQVVPSMWCFMWQESTADMSRCVQGAMRLVRAAGSGNGLDV